LKYEAQEIIRHARPLKKKEAELIEKLDHKFLDLKGLEEDCRKAEEKREKIVDTRNRLRAELEDIDTSGNPKDAYLLNFDEITPKVESFISLTKVIGESRPAPETKKVDIMPEIESIEEELDSLTKDVKEAPSSQDFLKYRERVGELKSHIKYLEAEIEKRLSEQD
jgi:peptidoglycan hydrolase CwlO-like protein